MGQESVSDILGKGLKFEQRVVIEFLPPDKLLGTIPAFIGGAHWGPVSTPTLVQKSFENYFGEPVIQQDENDNVPMDWSGLGADYHLKYSQLCYFTRITDGTDKAASRLLSKAAKVAKLVGIGAIQNTTVTIYPENTKDSEGADIQNDIFILNYDDKTKVVVIDPSTSAVFSVDVTNVNLPSLVDENIMFSIDDVLVTYKIIGTEPDLVASLQAALATAMSITQAEAEKYIYQLAVVNMSDLTTTFVADDVVKIGSSFYIYNGTIWSLLSVTEVASLPAVNLPDDGYAYATSEDTYHQFDKTGAGSFASITIEHEGSKAPFKDVVDGDYYYDTTGGSEDLYEMITSSWTSTGAAFEGILSDIPAGPSSVDDLYIDDGTTNEKGLYICTGSGTPGTWTLISAALWHGYSLGAPSGTLPIADDYYVSTGTWDASNPPVGGFATGYGEAAAGLYQYSTGWGTVLSVRTYADESTMNASILVDEAYYYETTGETFNQFSYTLNTFSSIDYDLLDYIVFKSQRFGTLSTVDVHNFPGTVYDQDNTISVTGADTPVNGIITDIQAAIITSDSPGGSAGLYANNAGTSWDLETEVTIYGDVPGSPSDNDYWKSDGSDSDYPYGFYQYDLATTTWEAVTLAAFGMFSTTPAAADYEDGDLIEVGGHAALSDITVGFDEFGRLLIATANAGVSETFNVGGVSGAVYDDLKIDEDDIASAKIGEDEEYGGKIEAIYSGEKGNDIYLLKTENINGYSLSVVMGDSLLGEFYNYSYTVADTDFIGDMINNDRVCSLYVLVTPESGATTIPEFELNTQLSLSGGSSGLSNLADFRYINAVQAYKNLDLYDVDIISMPGVIGENVADAVKEVCEYRKDCFGVLDTPQEMDPYHVEKWHDGESDTRTTQLDSMYLSVYYPWLLINTSSVKLPKQWAPPSIRVVGAIGFCDLTRQNKLNPPAGHKNCPITDIEALERYLSEEDKNTLYADKLDNNINSIVYTKNNGYFIDGQKTTKRGRHPFNRVKTMRTALHIKRAVHEIAPDYFWEPIDSRTQARLKADLDTMMSALVVARAIKDDFVTVCDGTINTEVVEADNGLIATITWSAVKSVEKLKIVSTIIDQQVQTTIEV